MKCTLLEDAHKPLFHFVSHENFWQLDNGVFYLGIDPTGSHLHIGHLISLRLSLELLKKGFKGIIIIGGFTGQIGDPTDKLAQRATIPIEVIQNNIESLKKELLIIFRNHMNQIEILNNANWLGTISFAEYLSFAYHISVNKKIKMDTFANRIKAESHLSMSEFTYSDLQAFDFYYLYKNYNCTIQIGGQDQWGNLSLGVHTLKKISGKEDIYAIATPLLVNNGVKMSKTSKAVNAFSDPFDVYDYLNRQSDEFRNELKNLMGFDDLFAGIQNMIGNDIDITLNKINCNSLLDVTSNIYYECSESKLPKILYFFDYVESISEGKNKIKEGSVKINDQKVLNDQILEINQIYKLSFSNHIQRFIKIIAKSENID